MNSHYLPKVPVAEEKLKMYDLAIENIRKRIENYNNEWSSNLNPQPVNYLNRFLINRSPTHGGLIECNIDRLILPIFEEVKYFDLIEIPLPAILIQMSPKMKKTVNIFDKTINVILLHNRILSSLSDKERLLFREHIRQMDRKLSPGIFKLTYNDEMTNDYITECLKNLDELNHFVGIYKTINTVNVNLFEQISNGTLLNLQFKSVGTLDQFQRKFKESRNASVKMIGSIYKRVIEYIIVIYGGFDNHLTEAIGLKWINYVRKIDYLAEYALLNCAKNTLHSVYSLLHGLNNMSPEPFISIDITLSDRKIVFEPSLESIAKSLNNIYQDIIKSVSIFPRLNDKFELPPTPEIRKFEDVVNNDKDCRKLLSTITDVIEHTFEKTVDYIYNWQHFESIWTVDTEKFMMKFQAKGMELNQFESAMLKYFDVSNQVMMQDTIVVVNYLSFNCSRLKEHVLEYIAGWKKSYKETLWKETLKKLEKLNEKLTSRIVKLMEQPTNFEELDEAMKLHEKSMKELKDREAEMDEIRMFHSYLGKFVLKI
jgi:dynein heavy chain, axonemal